MSCNSVLTLAAGEKQRILRFICQYANDNEPVCVFVSGGLDSDVVARLCVEALGEDRVRLVFVLQDDMEEQYGQNAYQLASDLNVPIDEINLCGMNVALVKAAEQGNPSLFCADSLLDPNRAKCSLRTALISGYQDKGFLIAGTSNCTEMKLGFFMPFGDNLAHFKPIAHLYKTQVVHLARELHCRENVISQPPSAAFWKGQEDLTDLAYWMINRAPIMGKGRKFSDEDDNNMKRIRAGLTQEAIDYALYAIDKEYDANTAAELSGLPLEHISALRDIVVSAKKWKNRPLLKCLE